MVSMARQAAAESPPGGAVAPSSNCSARAQAHGVLGENCSHVFDDGPNPAATPQLLDLFDRYSVHRHFFLIGKFARACPGLVKEIFRARAI